METDIQTSDRVVAMEKLAEQSTSGKCFICNSFKVILLIMEGTKKSESSNYSFNYCYRLPSYSPYCIYGKGN